MENIYKQDWHIHSVASYDGFITLDELIKRAKEYGLTQFGISDHVNYPFMIEHLKMARKLFLYRNEKVEGFHFGVELTTMSKFEIEYSRFYRFERGYRLPGYVRPDVEGQDPLDFPMTEEEIRELRVEYVIGAAHLTFHTPTDRKSLIQNWHDQQMLCATDARIDIVGHPWWCPHFPGAEKLFNADHMLTGEPWFDDFSVIPQSMHDEFAAALLENDKCAEMNLSFFYTPLFTDRFKHQYAEYIRMLFEKGVPITIGTDSHGVNNGIWGEYRNYQQLSEPFLRAAGFTADDFSAPKFRTYE